MTWPEVLRWLALVAGIAASIAGLAWTLGRIFRPWMREAADDVRAEVKALSDKLAANDFPHVEARIDRGLQDVGERIERVEARQRDGVPDTGGGAAAIGHGRLRSLNPPGAGTRFSTRPVPLGRS